MPKFYSFLEQFQTQMPGLTSEVNVSSDNTLSSELTGELKEREDDYRLLQYDLLFGEGYSEEALFP
ncbi:hypothetical protein D3C81_1317320 [compost metagenome]